MPARVEVELDIFSGMPNPSWVLTAAEADAFEERLAGLPPSASRSLSGQLGYRGFIVQMTSAAATRLVHVQTGTVQISHVAKTAHFSDDARGLERWLLQTGKPHLKQALFEVVERDLR